MIHKVSNRSTVSDNVGNNSKESDRNTETREDRKEKDHGTGRTHGLKILQYFTSSTADELNN